MSEETFFFLSTVFKGQTCNVIITNSPARVLGTVPAKVAMSFVSRFSVEDPVAGGASQVFWVHLELLFSEEGSVQWEM